MKNKKDINIIENGNGNGNKTRKNYNKTKIGGKVLGSGGFGCIFKPRLKCKNVVLNKSNNNQISKLMKKKNARKEFKEITKFIPFLQKIPNYNEYFLIENFSLCQPDTLSSSDLEDFNKKCSALKKIDISENNINNNLKKLLTLNMPYGGIDVDDFIEKYSTDKNVINSLNTCLIKLLKYGIIPMNKLGIFHCDLKSSNILVEYKKQTITTRIIDWGLSTQYSKNNPIPDILTRRPFQYNVPFSNILFNSFFDKMYNEFLIKLKNDNKQQNYDNTLIFTIDYVLKWIKERGHGHLKTINSILTLIFGNDSTIIQNSKKFTSSKKYELTFNFIFMYITKILITFTKNGVFDNLSYFNLVFLKNIDIWGLVMTYIPFLEHAENSDNKNKSIVEFFEKLMLLLIESSDKPISINYLISILNQFHKINNIYFTPISLIKTSTTSSTSSSTTSSTTSHSNKKKHVILSHDKHLSENTKKQ